MTPNITDSSRSVRKRHKFNRQAIQTNNPLIRQGTCFERLRVFSHMLLWMQAITSHSLQEHTCITFFRRHPVMLTAIYWIVCQKKSQYLSLAGMPFRNVEAACEWIMIAKAKLITLFSTGQECVASREFGSRWWSFTRRNVDPTSAGVLTLLDDKRALSLSV